MIPHFSVDEVPGAVAAYGVEKRLPVQEVAAGLDPEIVAGFRHEAELQQAAGQCVSLRSARCRQPWIIADHRHGEIRTAHTISSDH